MLLIGQVTLSRYENMRSRHNKRGASYAVLSWLPEALDGDLETLAAQRGITVFALVEEILRWGLAEERLQEEAFSHIAPAVSQLAPVDRRRLFAYVMRFDADDWEGVLLCAIVQAWLTVYAPERPLT